MKRRKDEETKSDSDGDGDVRWVILQLLQMAVNVRPLWGVRKWQMIDVRIKEKRVTHWATRFALDYYLIFTSAYFTSSNLNIIVYQCVTITR